MLSLVNEFTGKSLVFNSVECIACAWNFGKTCDLNRNGRTCALYSSALVVGHNSYTAYCCACDNNIALMESTVLNEESSDRTSALVKSCFDNSTLCKSVRVSLEFLYLSNEKNIFEKLIYTLACLSRNRYTDNVTAPVFANEVVLCKLFLYTVRVCAFLIHLVDSNDNGNACSLCMVDRLNSLRHDTVISSNNEDSNICDISTSCTH